MPSSLILKTVPGARLRRQRSCRRGAVRALDERGVGVDAVRAVEVVDLGEFGGPGVRSEQEKNRSSRVLILVFMLRRADFVIFFMC